MADELISQLPVAGALDDTDVMEIEQGVDPTNTSGKITLALLKEFFAGAGIDSVVAGDRISVDATDPSNPVVTADVQWEQLTQAEYDAIPVPDPATLYVIVG